MGARIPVPPHAYVPGQTARHPEGWFDGVRASVTADIPVVALDRTLAWQAGMSYFSSGYFWECHEVLEAVWLRTPDGSAEREMCQAMIQLANARLKVSMGKPRAVMRLCDRVDAHLSRCPLDRSTFGLTVAAVHELVAETRCFTE